MKEQEGRRAGEGWKKEKKEAQSLTGSLTRLFGFVSQQFVIRSEGG